MIERLLTLNDAHFCLRLFYIIKDFIFIQIFTTEKPCFSYDGYAIFYHSILNIIALFILTNSNLHNSYELQETSVIYL